MQNLLGRLIGQQTHTHAQKCLQNYAGGVDSSLKTKIACMGHYEI